MRLRQVLCTSEVRAQRRPADRRSDFVQVKISVRHGHLNEETQLLIRDKAEKLLHFFERLTMIEVTVDMKKDQKWVEFVVQAEHKHDIVAHGSHTDLLAAVDLTLDKLALQLRRYKEKIQDHRRTPSTGRVAGAPAEEEPREE
jgi:putative sigma-54 modulation protein